MQVVFQPFEEFLSVLFHPSVNPIFNVEVIVEQIIQKLGVAFAQLKLVCDLTKLLVPLSKYQFWELVYLLYFEYAILLDVKERDLLQLLNFGQVCLNTPLRDLSGLQSVAEMGILFLLSIWKVVTLFFRVQDRKRWGNFFICHLQGALIKFVKQVQIKQILSFCLHFSINLLTFDLLYYFSFQDLVLQWWHNDLKRFEISFWFGHGQTTYWQWLLYFYETISLHHDDLVHDLLFIGRGLLRLISCKFHKYYYQKISFIESTFWLQILGVQPKRPFYLISTELNHPQHH